MKKPLFIARQGRKPTGLFGRLVGNIMSRETAAANDIAIALLNVCPGDRVLDIGTGHGRSLGLLAELNAPGTVFGLDFSETMRHIAKRKNKSLIKQGRVKLLPGTSDNLPFPDCSFDKIMSVHTIYFWEDVQRHIDEIYRVTAPGGQVVLGFRPDEDGAITKNWPAQVYTFRTSEEISSLFSAAGFNVQTIKKAGEPAGPMNWLLVERDATGTEAA